MEKVQAVLKRHDFSGPDAFRPMLVPTALGNGLSFDCIVPGPETIAAMKELESGDVISFDNVADLMAYLNADGDEEA